MDHHYHQMEHHKAPPGAPPPSGGRVHARIAQSVANRLFGMANTKGFLLMFVLFLLRNRTISNITRKLALFATASVAFATNFNLDLNNNARNKGLTVGISRMFTLGLCFLIFKRNRWNRSPFYCGLVARVVPVSMYYFFRGIYEIAFRLLQRFGNEQLLPRSTLAVDSEAAQCCICLDVHCDYRTSCNHDFHRQCLEQWAEIRLHCPLCTQPIQTNRPWARTLQNYFVLNYNEWREMHSFLCGNWWTESVFSHP